jgi:hypothetical protein
MSQSELGLLRRRTRPAVAQMLTLAFLPLALACLGWGVGTGIGFLLTRAGGHTGSASAVGLWSFAALGLAIDVVAFRLIRRAGEAERHDLRQGEVETIPVASRRVIDLGSEAHPALVFDRGDGTLLYLSGSWLRDPASFDAQAAPAAGDTLPPANGQPRFPCTEFSIVRAPESGAVLRVETGGQPLSPGRQPRPPGMRQAMLAWRDSEIIEGSLP